MRESKATVWWDTMQRIYYSYERVYKHVKLSARYVTKINAVTVSIVCKAAPQILVNTFLLVSLSFCNLQNVHSPFVAFFAGFLQTNSSELSSILAFDTFDFFS